MGEERRDPGRRGAGRGGGALPPPLTPPYRPLAKLNCGKASCEKQVVKMPGSGGSGKSRLAVKRNKLRKQNKLRKESNCVKHTICN